MTTEIKIKEEPLDLDSSCFSNEEENNVIVGGGNADQFENDINNEEDDEQSKDVQFNSMEFNNIVMKCEMDDDDIISEESNIITVNANGNDELFVKEANAKELLHENNRNQKNLKKRSSTETTAFKNISNEMFGNSYLKTFQKFVNQTKTTAKNNNVDITNNMQMFCSKCNQTYSDRVLFFTHSCVNRLIPTTITLPTSTTILKPAFNCPGCPMIFPTESIMKQHSNLHTINTFFCSHNCGRYFKNIDECEFHEIMDHPLTTNYHCNMCNSQYSTGDRLLKHKESHRKHRRFCCALCREWFLNKRNLYAHWKRFPQTCGRLIQIEAFEDLLNKPEQPVTDSIQIATEVTADVTVATPAAATSERTFKRTATLSPSEYERKRSKISNDNLLPTSSLNMPSTPTTIKEEPIDYDNENAQLTNDIKLDDYGEPIDIKPILINGEIVDTQPLNNIIETVTIKSQPIDESEEEEINEPYCVSNLAEVVKTEPIDDEKPSMVQLKPSNSVSVYNLTPNFTIQTIPKGDQNNCTIKKSNNDIKISMTPTLTNKKVITTNKSLMIQPIKAWENNVQSQIPSQMIQHSAIQPLRIQNINTINNLQGLKLIKLMPNTKIVKIPVPKQQDNLNIKSINDNSQRSLLLINQQQLPDKTNEKTITKVINNINKITPTKTLNQNEKNDDEIEVRKSIGSNGISSLVPLNVQVNHTTYVKQSVKEVTESSNGFVIRSVEIQPENLKVIQNIRDQIKAVESYNQKDVKKTEQKFPMPMDVVTDKATMIAQIKPIYDTVSENETKPPSSMYLPIITVTDPELTQARRRFVDYRFVWICPKCPRLYEQKHAFRGHLVSAHDIFKDEFTKLIIEVKALKEAEYFEMHKKRGKDKKEQKSMPRKKSNEKLAEVKDEVKDEEMQKDNKETQAILSSNTSNTSENTTPTEDDDDADDDDDDENDVNDDDPNDSQKLDFGVSRSKTQTNKFTCIKCGRACSSKIMLSDHIRANCSREPLYPCTQCPKRFYSASTLNCHVTIHTGVLPHKCQFCDKHFRTRGQVTVHHRTHTGEKPFICQVCSQSFTHRETLISHLSRHIGMKRYKCYGCNKQFSCISGLKTHREVRPTTCGKVKFNSRAIGPRVRVIRGNVLFEPQPEINPYLKTEDPEEILNENSS